MTLNPKNIEKVLENLSGGPGES